jgi:iron(III) transport system ATP-binding protein
VVAVRPENISFNTDAPAGLRGKIAGMFYLGDINGCRVDINGEIIRVIAESGFWDLFREGQDVSLNLK